MKKNDLDEAFRCIGERIEPAARFVRHWPLTGGVSAQIEALELELPGGECRKVVVRRHSSAGWKSRQRNVTTMEYGLLISLFQIGLPVPQPLFLDVTASLLPSPYLVMEMVEATTAVHDDQIPHACDRMADFLLRLHALDIETLDLSEIPRLEDPVGGALEYVPDTDSWATLRRAIEAWQTAPSRDSLLHGDFWPGNILWKGNHIAAVIDWEDASIGTAVADLATCRVELMMMYGPSAMENFTRQYLTHSTLDISDLPLWEVYASSAALATMSGWNLAPEDEAKRRQGTTLFLNRAASETINRMNH